MDAVFTSAAMTANLPILWLKTQGNHTKMARGFLIFSDGGVGGSVMKFLARDDPFFDKLFFWSQKLLNISMVERRLQTWFSGRINKNWLSTGFGGF